MASKAPLLKSRKATVVKAGSVDLKWSLAKGGLAAGECHRGQVFGDLSGGKAFTFYFRLLALRIFKLQGSFTMIACASTDGTTGRPGLRSKRWHRLSPRLIALVLLTAFEASERLSLFNTTKKGEPHVDAGWRPAYRFLPGAIRLKTRRSKSPSL